MYNYRQLEPERLEFVTVAATEELPPGKRIFVDVDGERIVVFNVAGRYYAIRDACSHDGGPVGEGEVRGLEIECPRHGARFSLESGRALTLPAVVDIPAYPVRVVDGEVQVGLPIE